MLKTSFKSVSVKSISALLSASALVMGMGVGQVAQASEPFIGQIQMTGFNFAPRGWTFCDGQLLPISQNTALFSLLGTTYGGDGRTTFGLPDLRGRSAVHPGTGPGLAQIRQGERGGSEYLSINHLPSHSHTATLKGIDSRGDESKPGGHTLAEKSRTNIYSTAAPAVAMQVGSVVVDSTGGNQRFRSPYLGIYHSIALVGIFPSRN